MDGQLEQFGNRRTTVRQMIEQENQLRNQRLGYLLTLNGFLFAALAFAWKTKDARALVYVVALLGFVTGISAIAGMRISNLAIARLRDWSDTHTHSGDVRTRTDDWEAIDNVPPVVGMRGELPDGVTQALAPWNSLPWALTFVWPLVMVTRLAV
jgi:hypothetical protein